MAAENEGRSALSTPRHRLNLTTTWFVLWMRPIPPNPLSLCKTPTEMWPPKCNNGEKDGCKTKRQLGDDFSIHQRAQRISSLVNITKRDKTVASIDQYTFKQFSEQPRFRLFWCCRKLSLRKVVSSLVRDHSFLILRTSKAAVKMCMAKSPKPDVAWLPATLIWQIGHETRCDLAAFVFWINNVLAG